jgi:hypothetical protein
LVPVAARGFDDASDELIKLCGAIWERYQRNPDLAPQISRTGGYVYRGGLPLRLRVLVSMSARAEGSKPQVVDVVGADLRRSRNA